MAKVLKKVGIRNFYCLSREEKILGGISCPEWRIKNCHWVV